MLRGREAGLHPVRADNAMDRIIFPIILDNQVLANLVELVRIESRLIRTLQTLAHLDIEDSKSKTADCNAVFSRLRQTKAIPANLGANPVRYRMCWKWNCQWW
jgi:hypothetical protein